MSDAVTKFKRSQARKRNYVAKIIKDFGEHKGAFSMKVEASKQEYKRIKIKKEYIDAYEEDD